MVLDPDIHNDFAARQLSLLRSQDLYRRLNTDVVIKRSSRIKRNRKEELLNFSSNDYLGISTRKEVLQATIKSIKQISPCSSRLVAGNSPELQHLEEILALHRETEGALVFPTGYMANLGAISVLADEDCVTFSDELNHASIIDGCRLSRAKTRIFKHNDVSDLERQFKSVPDTVRKIVVTEGIFSMDGDMANLRDICDISSLYDAFVIVDDAHGDFVFGNSKENPYSGIPSYLGVNSRVGLHVSSLSKALGCFGGYVATSRQIQELLVNKSRQFIYTSSLPSHLSISAVTSMRVVKKGHLQARLFRNIEFISKALRQMGLFNSLPPTHIIPIMIGSEKNALLFSRLLMRKGILIQPIRFPTVKRGCSRIRISVSAIHTRADLLRAVDAIEYAASRLNML